MKAKIYNNKSISVISDDKFQSLVENRALNISKEREIDFESAYKIALAELSKIYKDFVYVPVDRSKYGSFATFELIYYEKDGKITNDWEVVENVNVPVMQNKIKEYEAEIAKTNDKIVEFCERMIMGETSESLRKEAEPIIRERNEYRSRISDINSLIDKVINPEVSDDGGGKE